VHWAGDEINSAVLGIGVNVYQGSAPEDLDLPVPASSVEEQSGRGISRLDLLVQIIDSLLFWYPQVGSQAFLTAWRDKLAYLNQRVVLQTGQEIIGQGILRGINQNGALILISDSGREQSYMMGEIHLRLVDRS
jgi:biotin-(acetyl-CoA carboxylase) ligase